ncbi:hypothetical protein RUM44_008280 [Polyplax serrata]|uniref:Uncharacterized protein n=1 Tax=Polyplax serrata TaxID=468196 RepID=A0ABR1BCR2_POLSC
MKFDSKFHIGERCVAKHPEERIQNPDDVALKVGRVLYNKCLYAIVLLYTYRLEGKVLIKKSLFPTGAIRMSQTPSAKILFSCVELQADVGNIHETEMTVNKRKELNKGKIIRSLKSVSEERICLLVAATVAQVVQRDRQV